MTSRISSHPLADDEALRKRLIALARRWLAHGAEAEDLVQDAYLRTANGTLPPTEAGREAWLVTVLHHLCIDFLRRQGRYQAILSQAVEEAAQAACADWPLRLADQAQRVEAALHHLCRTLAPGDAAVVLLYEIFGFSHAELGALTGRSEEASRQYLHRLLARLRSRLSVDRGPDENEQEDATYLFALCRHALARRDPGGLIAVLRACRPQMMAAFANIGDGERKGGEVSSGARQVHVRNLLAWRILDEASVSCG
ncbi:sigma-70 family RNA polymerase sigma factor [Pigmentiphaga sp. H8]|uniref:RNA polymerase sigma factor n=1 Tax=unclassified Pigmentiphaga TaxID=2626614 RepID=UPI000F5A3562|nr:RNA polymerase sigma factor [Pigmentiphaga sp. H8]AZG09112.1 sigma-70 family RNA polymerase sigma factor [Pigmentiphaga sp. H8]